MRLFRPSAAPALLLLLAAAACPAFADIALPDRPRANRNNEVRRDLPYSRLTIERVEGLREARLQIPRAQLDRMNAAAGVEGGATGGLYGSAGAVVGGLFLSLAVALTGLLLLRSRRGGLRAGRAAATVLGCACAAALAAVAAYANVAPPIELRAQDPGTLIRAASGGTLSGAIRIEVVEDGAELKLLVPARPRRAGGDEEE